MVLALSAENREQGSARKQALPARLLMEGEEEEERKKENKEKENNEKENKEKGNKKKRNKENENM